VGEVFVVDHSPRAHRRSGSTPFHCACHWARRAQLRTCGHAATCVCNRRTCTVHTAAAAAATARVVTVGEWVQVSEHVDDTAGVSQSNHTLAALFLGCCLSFVEVTTFVLATQSKATPQTTTHCRQHVLLHTKAKRTCSRASAARQSASPLVSQYAVCEVGTGPNGVCTHCSADAARARVFFPHHTQLC
jgi:hypothetical protein